MIIDWLGKHWKWAIAAFFIIVGLAIWITITSEHPISTLVIEVFKTWSPALGAAAALFLAIAAFAEIRQSRQTRARDKETKALERIEAWANSLTTMLSQASLDEPKLSSRLLPFIHQSATISTDTLYFNEEVRDVVVEAITSLNKLEINLNRGAKFTELVDIATKLGSNLLRVLMAISVERLKLK